MFKTAKTISFDLKAEIDFKCPHCDSIKKTTYNINPYRIPADDLPDEYCDNCKNFIKLTLYENEDE